MEVATDHEEGQQGRPSTEDMPSVTAYHSEEQQHVLEGGGEHNDAAAEKSLAQGQGQEEVLRLRVRGAELEERLVVARNDRTSARERREFMEEEAQQAREYDKKLAQEMGRLERIIRALPPAESQSFEKLRRLVATLTEIERQEQVVLEDGQAQEAAFRAEIEDFTGVGTGSHDDQGEHSTVTAGETVVSATAAVADDGRGPSKVTPKEVSLARRRARPGDGTVVLEKSTEDPLAMTEHPKENDERSVGGGGSVMSSAGSALPNLPRTALVMANAGSVGLAGGGGQAGVGGDPMEKRKSKRPAPEGKALLAVGLHRIEAAYQAAIVERDGMASRLSRLRLAVARRQREADATPGHAELLQYLLRFEELGQHSMERQEQLRRCRAERSTLVLTRELLTNQARLLETIAGGADEALNGPKGSREAFLVQITGIVEGVEDSLENQQRLLDGARNRRRTAEEIQVSVEEDKKRFLTGIKQLSDECYRYEALNAHLALMRR